MHAYSGTVAEWLECMTTVPKVMGSGLSCGSDWASIQIQEMFHAAGEG